MVASGPGYWSSPPGRWQQHRSRYVRTRWLSIPGEPIQKKSRGAKTRGREIRELVAAELRNHRRSTLRGDVAAAVRFTVARDQSPDLLKLTKFILDVLGRTGDPAAAGPSLFDDDSKVRMLHASWTRASTDEAAETTIIARSLRDVVADLRMAGDFRADSDVDDGGSPFAPDELDSDPRADDYLPPELQRQVQEIERLYLQHALLERSGASFRRLLADTADRLLPADPPLRPRPPDSPDQMLSRYHDQLWQLVLSNPPTIPLPALPMHPGDSINFTDQLMEQLHKHATVRHLIPAESALGVRIVVVPPAQAKDLDNLASVVLNESPWV